MEDDSFLAILDDMEYKHWKVTIKEVGKEKAITTEIHGCYDEKYVVDFYGLTNDDVEWYKLEELK